MTDWFEDEDDVPMIDATTRAYLAQLAAMLREAIGDASGRHLGKKERMVRKVAMALEEMCK